MRAYYENCFPYEWIERFLTCNGKYPLNKREFSFRKNDFWIKHKKFNNLSDCGSFMLKYGYTEKIPNIRLPLRFGNVKVLKEYMVDLVPDSINVGPVYYSIYSQYMDRKNVFADKQCPLVFDVDIKDYKEKTCCKELCDLCWITYGRVALVDLVNWLKNFMQFKHILPVDSGFGGFHVYVLDERVWTWDQETRSQFYRYIPKSVILDKSIEGDFTHLAKIPFSPNPKNGCLSLPILDIHTYLPSRDRIKVEKANPERIDFLINKFIF